MAAVREGVREELNANRFFELSMTDCGMFITGMP